MLDVAVAQSQLDAEIDAAWEMGEDVLLQQLGLAQLGTQGVVAGQQDMNFMIGAVGSPNVEFALGDFLGNLLEKGKNFFFEVWDFIKETVCEIYKEDPEVEEGKSFAKYLAEAVLAGVAVAGKWAALIGLVVVVAIKKGLNLLCEIPSAN